MLNHLFYEVWEFLRREGRTRLETGRERTPFEIEAHIVTKGAHKGEKVI